MKNYIIIKITVVNETKIPALIHHKISFEIKYMRVHNYVIHIMKRKKE